MSEQIFKQISRDLKISPDKIEQTVALLDEGNTVPFIARYRKEATGGLSDEEVRLLEEKLSHYRHLEQRREEVLRLIDEQNLLEPVLQKQIEEASSVTELNDLYRPFRPKRKTRASVAREKGLAPLSLKILEGSVEPEEEAEKYLDPEKDLTDVAAVLQGASDIIAEIMSDDALLRKRLRALFMRTGEVKTQIKEAAATEESKYQDYADFSEPLAKIKGHRVLAINRAVREKALSFKITVDEEKVFSVIKESYLRSAQGASAQDFILEALKDSYKRLIHPSLENELWQDLFEQAAEGAILVFKANLKKRLLVPPLDRKRVLGWDPGFRTGCKLALVSETGKLLETATIYPTAPALDLAGAKKTILKLLEKHHVDYIALGNGTASRESEAFIAQLIEEEKLEVQYTIVNEAGASVYSSSKAAQKEFPDLDVTERSAVSIARRLQDPLAELVKIDPKAIGVGQYQHDMPAKVMDQALSGTVESCVNSVGVELNSASSALLTHVAGVSAKVAQNIVERREAGGPFKARAELLKVPGLGPKTFEQCAGFLRLAESDNYLERSAVHPESYALAGDIMTALSMPPEALGQPEKVPALSAEELSALARNLEAGLPTVRDILDEFRRPGRDPRLDLPRPVFAKSVTTLEDLAPGMVVSGIVRNIVDFGAFVDIGVHQDGLVHISELANRYVKHPLDVLQIEEAVKVKILSVDHKRGRISLSIKQALA